MLEADTNIPVRPMAMRSCDANLQESQRLMRRLLATQAARRAPQITHMNTKPWWRAKPGGAENWLFQAD